jgi:RNA recognition motif-containing protein
MASSDNEPVKRKRSENEADELEINLNLPEPPSKKAKRKEKKQAKTPSAAAKSTDDATQNPETSATPVKADNTSEPPAKRSEFGIWIGNLPFNADKEALRKFLKDKGGIDENDITRLNMPAGPKVNNKGFAYVDFTTDAVLQIALALSEQLLNGRAVLIKNAKSYEGRPAKPAFAPGEEQTIKINGKEPSKRVFVGNLGFDATKEELAEHFSRAGEIEDVFVATFQDTGKCKGFAWVRFTDIKAAESAVKGYILEDDESDADEEDEAEAQDDSGAEGDDGKPATKKSKRRNLQRRYINRMQGRQLRCEFAEDAQTRYKKRFGKNAERDGAESRRAGGEPDGELLDDAETAAPKKRPDRNLSKDERQELRRKRHIDARTIAPGKALAGAQRATGAIVAGAGKKTTFE